MKPGENPCGFWASGYQKHLDALEEEEALRLTALKEELHDTSDPERIRRIREEIKAIRREFRQRRDAAEGSLFLLPPSND